MKLAIDNKRLETIDKSLKELGLSEYERKLYLISLTLGPSSITDLAEHLGISRPNVYKVITGLEKRGLAEFRGGKTYKKSFFVESPSTIAELLRKKKETIDSIDTDLTTDISALMSLYEQGRMPANVKVLRGKKEFLTAYLQVFEEASDEIQFFGSLTDFLNTIDREIGKQRIKRRIEKQIPIKALVLPSQDADDFIKKDKQEFRETRILNGATPFITSFYLFANKAIFWQPMTPMAVMIEDEYLVAMWRSMFGLLWNKREDIV